LAAFKRAWRAKAAQESANAPHAAGLSAQPCSVSCSSERYPLRIEASYNRGGSHPPLRDAVKSFFAERVSVRTPAPSSHHCRRHPDGRPPRTIFAATVMWASPKDAERRRGSSAVMVSVAASTVRLLRQPGADPGPTLGDCEEPPRCNTPSQSIFPGTPASAHGTRQPIE